MQIHDTQNLQLITDQLQKSDPHLAPIIKTIGSCRLSPGAKGFTSIVRSIINQQLSRNSAHAIFARFQSLFVNGNISAEYLVTLTDIELRQTGLSYQKTKYLRDLAEHVLSGKINFSNIEEMEDEEVIKILTQVKGIGRWTAEMFLMFSLNRLDVFPIDDVALRTAIKEVYGISDEDFNQQALEIADRWKPYRSIACWYLYTYLNKLRQR